MSSVNVTDITLRLGASVSNAVQEQPLLLVGVALAVLLAQPQLLVWILHMMGLGSNGPLVGENLMYAVVYID